MLSSSNRKYPPFPLLSYFSVVVFLRYLLHHILSLIAYTFRENREFVFIIIMQFMMSANIRIRFGFQIVFVSLYNTPSHYHHCANLSEGIELIIVSLTKIHLLLITEECRHLAANIGALTLVGACDKSTFIKVSKCCAPCQMSVVGNRWHDNTSNWAAV